MNPTAISTLAGQLKTETSAARKAIASAYFRLWDKPGGREVEAADIDDRASSADETASPTARTGTVSTNHKATDRPWLSDAAVRAQRASQRIRYRRPDIATAQPGRSRHTGGLPG